MGWEKHESTNSGRWVSAEGIKKIAFIEETQFYEFEIVLETKEKLPIIGYIPIIGNYFTHKSKKLIGFKAPKYLLEWVGQQMRGEIKQEVHVGNKIISVQPEVKEIKEEENIKVST